MIRFRKLSEGEREHLQQLRRKGRLNGSTVGPRLEIAFQHSGNFTIALLRGGNYVRTGVAKRNPIDKNNQLGGERLALARAARSSSTMTIRL